MSEHTPTPWSLFDLNGVLAIKNPRSDASHNEIVFWTGFDASHYPKQARANAAFIVTAVNNHDALVNALRNARNYIDAVIINTPDKKKRRNFSECLRIIEAALEPVGGPHFPAEDPSAHVGGGEES